MKRLLIACALALLPSWVSAQDQETIADQAARGTLQTTDLFECEDVSPPGTYKCTLAQIINFVLTYVDTEAELEAVLTDVTDILTDSETAAEAYSIDWGGTMPVSPSQGDWFYLTDADSADDCDPEGGGGMKTLCYYNGASWEGLHAWLADDSYGDLSVSGGAFSINSGVVDSTAILDSSINEADINATNSPTDTYVLSWNTGDTLSWVSNSTGSESDPTLTDDDAATLGDDEDDGGADFVLTFDADTGTDGTITWDVSADEFLFNAPVSVPASPTPTSSWTDSDTTDDDVSTQIVTNCTDTGSGTEDCDITYSQQVAGAMTAYMTVDADGATNARVVLPNDSIGPDEIKSAGQVDESCLTYEATGDTVQWQDCGTGGSGIAWSTIGTAIADSSGDTMTVTDGIGINFTTSDDPEDLTAELRYNHTRATNPGLGADQGIFTADGVGGLLSEGQTADGCELLWQWPKSDVTLPCTADELYTLVATTTTQTLTNKTMSAASNVIDADTAIEFAANPADCTANQYAQAIGLDGDLTCAALSDADVPDTLTLDLEAGTMTNVADDEVPVGDSSGSITYIAIPDCDDEAFTLAYDTATNAFSCNADAGAGAGMTSWTAQADDTNTMTIQDGETVDLAGGLGLTTTAATGTPEQWTVEIDYITSYSGDVALNSNECVFSDGGGAGGGGWICEGYTADANELAITLPIADPGSDTTVVLATNTQAATLQNKTLDSTNTIEAGAYDAASIDGDDIASNIAGSFLTLTAGSPDTLNVDTELYKDSECVYIEDPVSDEEFYSIHRAAVTYNISAIFCEVTNGTSVLLDLEVDDGTPTGVNGSNITCTTSGTEVNPIGDTQLADGETLDLDLGTVTGAVDSVTVCWEYTKADV